MPYTLNGQPLQRARLKVGRHGLWTGTAAVAGPLTIADGAAVELELGDTLFRGHVIPGAGGTFVEEASFAIAAGTGGWAKGVAAKGYQVPSGVSLATVAAELATATGERLDVTGVTRVLGDHWTRPAGPGSVALAALFPLEQGGWRADPDGVARPGVRPPALLPPSVELAVEDYQPASRWARVGLPGDQVSAVLPGAILTGPTLQAPLVVGETTIEATADAVVVEVLGEGGVVELFAALVQALTPSRIFGSVWTYQVADADTGRPNLKALASVAGLPAELAVDKIPGLPGATSVLQPGALVLVGFRDGDPAKPFVAGYIGGMLPVSVSIDATTSINLGGTVAVADAVKTNLALAQIRAAVNLLGGALPPLGDVSFAKLKGG